MSIRSGASVDHWRAVSLVPRGLRTGRAPSMGNSWSRWASLAPLWAPRGGGSSPTPGIASGMRDVGPPSVRSRATVCPDDDGEGLGGVTSGCAGACGRRARSPTPHPRRRWPAPCSPPERGLPAIGWSRPALTSRGSPLVARTWDPGADSPFGHYWVDRPPLLLALDPAHGHRRAVCTGIRWVAVVGSALLVLAAGGRGSRGRAVGCARCLRPHRGPHRARARRPWRATRRSTSWPPRAKIAVPAGARGLGLAGPARRCGPGHRARRRLSRGCSQGRRSGCKQNLAGALVFAAVLLVGEWVRSDDRRSARPRADRRGLPRRGGRPRRRRPCVWAVAEGVRLSALWYALFGFRADAFDVIVGGPLGAPLTAGGGHRRRGVHLGTGAPAALVRAVAAHASGRERPVLTLATPRCPPRSTARRWSMGGSYWRPYLFGLVPAAGARPSRCWHPATPGDQARARHAAACVTGVVVAVLVAGSRCSAAVQWARDLADGSAGSTSALLGARDRCRRPSQGDTLTVWRRPGRRPARVRRWTPPTSTCGGLPARHPRSGVAAPGRRCSTGHGHRRGSWPGPGSTPGRTAPRRPWARSCASGTSRSATACGGHVLYRLRDEPRPAPAVGCARRARWPRAAAERLTSAQRPMRLGSAQARGPVSDSAARRTVPSSDEAVGGVDLGRHVAVGARSGHDPLSCSSATTARVWWGRPDRGDRRSMARAAQTSSTARIRARLSRATRSLRAAN